MGGKKVSIALLVTVLLLAVAGTLSLQADHSALAASGPDRVDALYFHRTERCPTCNQVEKLARETLDANFADDLKSGKVTFQSLDYQTDKAMADKYKVKMQGLKLRVIEGGNERVVEVPELWMYAHDPLQFNKALTDAINKALGR